jgi:glycosyltransferase involved in cell wall biosynthesis
MRLLIFTNHFYPEQFKVNDIAFDFVRRGDDVTVVTGIPNYPKGKFFDGYGFFKRSKEMVNGVRVIRLPLIPRGKGTGVRLAINYMSYFLSTVLYVPFLMRRKYDCVFVHETSPIFIGVAAVMVKRRQHIPLHFWTLDLWPESVTAASSFSNRRVIHWLTALMKWIYNNSDKILISSRGYVPSIVEKGDFRDKIVYFPNWAEDIFAVQDTTLQLPDLPDGFKVMYAGNMGEAQDFEAIMEAAKCLKDQKQIKWIFVGDGRKKEWVDNFISTHQLQETVYTLGRFPINFMPVFYGQADVMLLSLKDKPIFGLTVPARLQSYMICAKPVAAMINGEAAAIIEEAQCGLAAASGDGKGLAENILKLSQRTPEELEALGCNAKTYYQEHFEKESLLDKLHELLEGGKYSHRNHGNTLK